MRIYIAGPFGRSQGASTEEIEANVARAIEVGRAVITRGHKPFVPHLFYYLDKDWDNSPDENEWMKIVSEFIAVCQGFLIYEESPGALRELRMAKSAGLKIYYDINDIPNSWW